MSRIGGRWGSIAAGLLLALGAADGSAEAAPAPASCPRGNVCLYDGIDYTGAWNRHGCDRKSIPFTYTAERDRQSAEPDVQDAPFFRRVSSVYNRCGHGWRLFWTRGPWNELETRWSPAAVAKPHPVVRYSRISPYQQIPRLGRSSNDANVWLTDPNRYGQAFLNDARVAIRW